MTIEEKINKIFEKYSPETPLERALTTVNMTWFDAETEIWVGKPMSHFSDEEIHNKIYINGNVELVLKYNIMFNSVDKIIQESDLTECLTSKSEYIRECKKWYMEEEL